MDEADDSVAMISEVVRLPVGGAGFGCEAIDARGGLKRLES